MRWDFKKELTRKSIHLLTIFILVVYFVFSDIFNKDIALLILVLVLIISLEFEYFRIEVSKEIPILKHLWKFRRPKERVHIGGDVFFLIGSILVLAVFDLRIAMSVILMTIFGDSAAALVGKKFGKNYFMKERAWEGVLAEFFVDLLIGIIVFFWISPSLIPALGIWIIIFVMAITATFVETIVYKLDDNLLIPVFSGFAGQVALIIINRLFLI